MRDPEVKRQFGELCALVERQRLLIVRMDRNGNDVGVEKNILDSLLVSLFLCINMRNGLRSDVELRRLERKLAVQAAASCTVGKSKSPQLKAWAEETKSAVVILFPRFMALGRKRLPMPIIDESNRQLVVAPSGPNFRELTQEEQQEYIDSLSDEAKKILAALMDKKGLSEPAAASISEKRESRPALRLLNPPSDRVA
jgi:septal ring factor EnvC (AmiA/AmiB activator)